jgi:hypothetical protein
MGSHIELTGKIIVNNKWNKKEYKEVIKANSEV